MEAIRNTRLESNTEEAVLKNVQKLSPDNILRILNGVILKDTPILDQFTQTNTISFLPLNPVEFYNTAEKSLN